MCVCVSHLQRQVLQATAAPASPTSSHCRPQSMTSAPYTTHTHTHSITHKHGINSLHNTHIHRIPPLSPSCLTQCQSTDTKTAGLVVEVDYPSGSRAKVEVDYPSGSRVKLEVDYPSGSRVSGGGVLPIRHQGGVEHIGVVGRLPVGQHTLCQDVIHIQPTAYCCQDQLQNTHTQTHTHTTLSIHFTIPCNTFIYLVDPSIYSPLRVSPFHWRSSAGWTSHWASVRPIGSQSGLQPLTPPTRCARKL